MMVAICVLLTVSCLPPESTRHDRLVDCIPNWPVKVKKSRFSGDGNALQMCLLLLESLS
jgi:hypothetical protein